MEFDYDAPRRTGNDPDVQPLRELTPQRLVGGTTVLDVDDPDPVESFELPGADLSQEELWVRVVPKRADEFTCTSCFLVCHRSRLARTTNGALLCAECA